MANLTILEAFNQSLSATKKYVDNRINGLASETYVNNAIAGFASKADPSFTGNVTVAGKVTVGTAPTADMDVATKKYIDEKIAEVNASGGYTHPNTHPASMITGLATVATSGSYNDLNDKPTIPDVSDKANISGQVFTGVIEAPTVIASTYFRTPALVGEGDNSAYYHRVNFGYQNHDYWEFHEYGGDYRFYENKNGTAAGGTMIANIKSTYSDFKGEVRENGTRVYSPNNKPTADDLGITIPSIDGLATETYVNNKVAGLIDSAPEALNTLNELATALGNDANFATTISNQIGLKVNSADLATVATSGSYNDLSDKPTIPAAYTHPTSHPASMITGLHTVATSGDYNDLNNKPSIPTVTNDLTDSLKANYDAAYTHSTSAHAPSNAQKNSDITKAEIEAKLTGDVTTHTHSQYLTEHQSLTGYATEEFVNNRLSSLQIVPITQADYDALETKDPNTLYLITTSNAGSIDSNNHITLSSDLPSGRYTLKYENENGQPLSDFEDITIMEV